MTVSILKSTCGKPYLTKNELSKLTGMSLGAVNVRVDELKQETQRYGEYAYIKDGGFVLVNFLAWTDFLKYRQMLKEKNMRKHVPNYDPVKIAKAIGWYGEEGQA